MRVIASYNIKGGVGKTTTAVKILPGWPPVTGGARCYGISIHRVQPVIASGSRARPTANGCCVAS